MRRDEAEVVERFAPRYAVPRAEVNHVVERAVIGSDWGANGYTTLAQADELATLLRLGAGSRLLDLGSGRGWPGLYLAAATGAAVVLTDLPRDGLRDALVRARSEGLARVAAVVTTGSRLPLRAGSFDAVVSADVLC